jgi:hypothetical protein
MPIQVVTFLARYYKKNVAIPGNRVVVVHPHHPTKLAFLVTDLLYFVQFSIKAMSFLP